MHKRPIECKPYFLAFLHVLQIIFSFYCFKAYGSTRFFIICCICLCIIYFHLVYLVINFHIIFAHFFTSLYYYIFTSQPPIIDVACRSPRRSVQSFERQSCDSSQLNITLLLTVLQYTHQHLATALSSAGLPRYTLAHGATV